MKPVIFYDTETTGLPNWGEPSESITQPHIVQLAAVMVDEDTNTDLQCIDLIIKPNGWEITPEMTAIHGITHEMAMDLGVSEKLATEVLIDMIGNNLRVAHNQAFDERIVRIAAKRYLGESVSEAWKLVPKACTAQLSRPICALLGSKIPTMEEAYKHFFGEPHAGAHTALGDAVACRSVYFAIKALAKAA